ncbi:hypothetical protein WA158_005388 [Blastocystis sp. Blastoise]
MEENQVHIDPLLVTSDGTSAQEDLAAKKIVAQPLSEANLNDKKISEIQKKRRFVPMTYVRAPGRESEQQGIVSLKNIAKHVAAAITQKINVQEQKEDETKSCEKTCQSESDTVPIEVKSNLNEKDSQTNVCKPLSTDNSNNSENTQQVMNTFYIHDIDSTFDGDSRFFSKYAASIYRHYRSIEAEYLPRENYLKDIQPKLQPHMRSVLIDWIIEIINDFHIRNETLFLTVNYIDRFLSLKPINRNQLQLLGCACLSLAAKYEECSPPRLSQIIYMTVNTYTIQQLRDYEVEVMNTLQFKFTAPTAYRMMKRFLLVSMAKIDESYLAMFILELSLLHYRFIRTLPSLLAASSLYLARSILNIQPVWTDALIEHTQYTEDILTPVYTQLKDIFNNKPQPELSSVYRKYQKKEYACITNRFTSYSSK